jgi:two-component system chemotaxis response regulator CheY
MRSASRQSKAGVRRSALKVTPGCADVSSVPSVLIVEDDPDMRELERTALECDGFEVQLASNGHDALRLLDRVRPCVILLDLMMPGMDGLTFLAESRRRPDVARVPVICVSAAGAEMMAHALRLGARECLAKPTDFDQLCERVRRHCE